MTDRPIAQRMPTAATRPMASERADDGAEVVHGAFEPVGAAVGGGGDDVGEQRVAGGDAQASGGPGAGAQHGDLPDAGGGADAGGEDGGGGVAADGDAAAPVGFVGERAAAEAGGAGEGVGDAFDDAEAEAGAPRVEVSRRRQQRGGDLVADVGEEAGGADPGDAGGQPPVGRLGRVGVDVVVGRLTSAVCRDRPACRSSRRCRSRRGRAGRGSARS